MPHSLRIAIGVCTLAPLFMTQSGCSGNREPAEEAARPGAEAGQDAKQHHPPQVDLAPAEEEHSLALNVPTEPPTHAKRELEPVAPLPAAEAPLPLDYVPLAELTPPNVVLGDQHAALCKVRVGDVFPLLELNTLAGEPQSLATLYGSKLTLIVFWNSRHPNGLEELSDMQRYFLPRFAERGLAVLSIHTGEAPEVAQPLVEAAAATYPIFSDADGAALAQVSSGMLPRTYLVDPAGKILWLDLEYSATTRRDLAKLLRLTFGE